MMEDIMNITEIITLASVKTVKWNKTAASYIQSMNIMYMQRCKSWTSDPNYKTVSKETAYIVEIFKCLQLDWVSWVEDISVVRSFFIVL